MNSKFTAIALIILIITVNLYSANDPLNITSLRDEIKKEAQKEFESVMDIFSSGLNSGIYAAVSGKVLSVGIQANIIPIKDEGLLRDADISSLILPFLYAGARIPGFGINLFARGAAFPYKDKTTTIIGLGGGWEPDLLPVIMTKLIIQYHFLKDFPYIEGNSFGMTMLMAITIIPLIHPFISFGLNNSTFAAPGVQVLDETESFTMNENKVQAGVGVHFLNFITLEAGFMPAFTGSLSLGLSF
ncbi:MAG: hypothetical protein KKH98_01860 [Spirochaetes bacterium]|nr:hypothetical protein [Spirochaetota bacterium]